VRQARYELIAEEQELVFRVAKAHFDHLAAVGDLEFAAAERAAIERQLTETEERMAAGLATITAVHESRARSELGRAAEIQATELAEATRYAIAELTGSVPEDLARVSETFPLVTPERPDVAAWIEASRFQNPRVKAAEAQAEAIAEDIRRQRGAARIPALDFVTVVNESDTGGSEFGGGRDIVNTTLGVRVTVPIYDGGRAAATIRGTSFRYRQALERIEAERRRVERETRESFQGVVAGISRVQALIQSVFFQETTVSEKEEALRAGLVTGLAVLDARRDLFYARRDLARARYEYLLNTLKLKQSAGLLGPEDLRQIDAYMQ
jgi:outer membrane protein